MPSCSLGFGVSFSHDGHVLFYRHGISIPCLKNSINVLKVLKLYCCKLINPLKCVGFYMSIPIRDAMTTIAILTFSL